MAMIQPLDLQTILVNVFAGSWDIFVMISFIVIAFLSAKFKLNNIAFGMILALYCVLIGYWVQWALLLASVIAGFAIFFAVGRLVK